MNTYINIKAIVVISITAIAIFFCPNAHTIQSSEQITQINNNPGVIVWLIAGRNDHFGPRFLKDNKHMSWWGNPIIETGQYYKLFEQKINALINTITEQNKALDITLKDIDYDDPDSLLYDQDKFAQLAKTTNYMRHVITKKKYHDKIHVFITYNNELSAKAIGLLSQLLTQDTIHIKTKSTDMHDHIIDTIKNALKENFKVPKVQTTPAQVYHININILDFKQMITDLQAVLFDGKTPEFDIPIFTQNNIRGSYSLDSASSAKICQDFNIKYPDKLKSYFYPNLLFPCNKKSRNQIIVEIAAEIVGYLIQKAPVL